MNPYYSNLDYANTIAGMLTSTSQPTSTSPVIGALTASAIRADGGKSFVYGDYPVGGMTKRTDNTSIIRDKTPPPTTQQITAREVDPQPARQGSAVNPARATQSKGNGGELGKVDYKGSGLSGYQVEHYMRGAANVIQAGTSIVNGYTAYSSAYMKAEALKFEAEQNERNAQLLYKNIREINRAADADANVYRVQGAATKSAQRVAMGASGFAVGKGIYKTTLHTTDARTEYNAALLKLKAGLQSAEILRQIGVQDAEAIIKKAEASISRKSGRAQLAQGISNGIANLMSAGGNFYMGWKGEGATKGGA